MDAGIGGVQVQSGAGNGGVSGADAQPPQVQLQGLNQQGNVPPPPQPDKMEGAQEPEAPVVFMKEKSGKAIETEGTSGEKKEKPKFCFRCWKPGHKKEECKAQLLCKICLSTEHITAKCTVYKNPRLIATPVGYEADGLGFYHIPYTPLPQVKRDNKTALIKVEGGSLSADQLVQELTRLIPERWNWQVDQLDKNSFVVPFPTKADLQRSVAFGKADIKSHGVSLLFEEWKEEDEGDELETAQMRVFNLPKKLRVYPVLWAIGSMLGAPQDVDMVTTDANDFGRILVAVMDVSRIPQKFGTVIGKRYYHLFLQVEGRDSEPMTETMELDGDGDHGNDNGNGKDKKEDGETEQQNGGNGKLEKKNTGAQSSNNNQQTNKKGVASAVLVEEIDAMEDSDNILRSSKYPNENGAGLGLPEGVQSMNWAQDLHMGLRGACSHMVGAQAHDGGILLGAAASSGLTIPNVLVPAVSSVTGLAMMRQDGPTRAEGPDDQAKLQLVQRKEQTPEKRSRRREYTADEDSRERAERLKAKRLRLQ